MFNHFYHTRMSQRDRQTDRQRCHSIERSVVGRPLVKRSPYAIRPLKCLSFCDVSVLWPNGWMDQDETGHGGIRRCADTPVH